MAYRLDSPNIVEIYGKKYYNSPKPCHKGHIGLHYLSGMCVECLKVYAAEIHKKSYQKSTRCLIQKTPEYLQQKAIKEDEYKKKWYENNKKRQLNKARIKEQKLRKDKPYDYLIKRAKIRAHKRGLEYNLTSEWGERRWTGKCEISQVSFQYFENNVKGYFYSPSIDRIESQKGYTQDNCRFILYAINIMKGSAADADVLFIAKALMEAQKS